MNSSISDRIQRQMEQIDGLTVEGLQPLADVYSNEVDQVNARLEECVQLLCKGLRSEAIQRANMRPNVLDWSASLDFPGLEDWLAILQFFGIGAPTNLNRDAARQVQEAVIEEQPLEDLLRQHRRMAIAKAPLRWRLKILRRLRAVDSANPVWAEDQQAWELVRLKQIPNQLTHAVANRLLDDCNELAEELTSSAWLHRPSEELRQMASKAADDLAYADQSLRLQAIADQLHAAFGEGNYDAAVREQQCWQALVLSMKKQPPLKIVQMAEPALEWLAEQNAGREKSAHHEAATHQLQKLLEGDSKYSELQKTYHEIVSLDLGIDPTLDRRYAAKVSEIELHNKRRNQFAYFAVATVALVLMGLFGYWQWSRAAQKQLATARTELKTLIDGERWQEAQDLRNRLESRSPSLLASPSIAALDAQLRSKLDDEKSRQKRFVDLIEKVETDDPSSIDLDTLRAAEKEAKTDDEKARTEVVRRARERYETSIRDQQFDEVTKQLEVANQSFEKMESMSIFEIDEHDLGLLIGDLDQLRAKFPKAGSQAEKMISLSLQKMMAFRDSFRQQRQLLEKRASLIKEIREATTLEAYRSRIEAYVQELPTDSQTGEFIDVLRETDLWHRPIEWNAWSQHLQQSVQSGLSNDEASKIVVEFEELKVRLKDKSAWSIYPNFESELETWKTRPGLIAALIDDLENSVIADLVTVNEASRTNSDGSSSASQRWFMNYDERTRRAETLNRLSPTASIGLFIVTDGNGSTSSRPFRGKPTIGDDPRALIRATVKRLRENQSRMILGWDTTFVSMIKDFQTSKSLDHAIQLVLLPRVLEAGNQGSPLLNRVFDDLRTKLIDQEEIRARWFNPRVFASDLPGDLEARLQEAIVVAQRESQRLEAAFDVIQKRRYVWVGSLLRDTGNQLQPWMIKGNPPDGQLFVVKPVAGELASADLVPIGSIKNGQTNWSLVNAGNLSGCPIFFLRSP